MEKEIDPQGRGAIIVSGGSRGLGAALVERLLADGEPVATFSRSPSDLSNRLRGHPRVYWEHLDATDFTATSAFVREAEKRFGKISALVNNAGVGADGVLATASLQDIRRTLDTNMLAPLQLTKLVVSRMLKHGDGCVINVSSILGLRGHSGTSVYAATKGALDAMTRSLAKELGGRGIRVNSVAPGYFASEMVKDIDAKTLERIKRRTPLGRLCTEAEIVSLIVFLIREGSFITGQTIAVDGGYTC